MFMVKKMAQPGEKNITAYIDPKVAEDFSKQCEKIGYQKYRAIEGALKAFISLPEELQVAMMKNTNQDTYKLLVHGLRDIELIKGLQALTPEQRLILIESSKEVSKRLFPKKTVAK